MRSWRSLALIGILAGCLTAIGTEQIYHRKSGETWKDLKQRFTHLKFIRSFGPHDQYGLFRSDGPLPVRERENFQSNLSYRALNPAFGKSWALKNVGQLDDRNIAGVAGVDIGVERAWERHEGSAETLVAIIDSGVEGDHEELDENLWRNHKEIPNNEIDDDNNGYVDDAFGWNFYRDNADIQDPSGHGTFIAGIIGAKADNGFGSRGINRDVKMMAVRFLDAGGFGKTAHAVCAIQYAVENGAKIINASWGGYEFDLALYQTIRWAGEQGVLFVAAAGNDSVDNDQSRKRTYPAAYRLPNVISVAAYDNQDKIWENSNWGVETVHLGAPGVSLYSTALKNKFRWASGTSFAAPFVSAVAALLWSYEPRLSVAQVKQRLIQSSEVIHYYAKHRVQSAGRVHAGNALWDYRPNRPHTPTRWESKSVNQQTKHPYVNNAKKRFVFQWPGANYVRVHFKKFETEACCDKVTLTDAKGVTVMEYSGELGEFWSAEAQGSELRVELVSDNVQTGFGFEIDLMEASYELPYSEAWGAPLKWWDLPKAISARYWGSRLGLFLLRRFLFEWPGPSSGTAFFWRNDSWSNESLLQWNPKEDRSVTFVQSYRF